MGKARTQIGKRLKLAAYSHRSTPERPMDPRDRNTADERGVADRTTTPEHRPALTELKPGQPNTSDEAGDVSIANADNPMLVREDVNNTSDSSGLHVDDPARGDKLKEQLRGGAREVQPMD
jgi:hypothetical protein